MKEWGFSEADFWHGKLFTLNWNFARAWLVMVHHHNGESKPWYRSTERSWRFRRWFFKKACDSFSNLASFRHPNIRLYVFSGFSPFPSKINIPMEVRLLRVHEPVPAVGLPQVKARPPVGVPKYFQLSLEVPVPLPMHQEFRRAEAGSAIKLNIASHLQADFEKFRKTALQNQK